MVAIGCLMLVILPIFGLAVGGWLSGPSGAIWGAGAGLVLALAICALGASALVQAGRKR